MSRTRHKRHTSELVIAGLWLSIAGAGSLVALFAMLSAGRVSGNPCGSPAAAGQVALGPPGGGALVGATEYGGPDDQSSGTVGASGVSLLSHPNSYAELGGYSFQTATAMGGLPYMTPLRVTWGGHSAIAYKRDFGLGGGPIDGLPRVIDLWWQFAGGLGIPYDNGLWSGPVQVSRPPASGAAALLGQGADSGAPGWSRRQARRIPLNAAQGPRPAHHSQAASARSYSLMGWRQLRRAPRWR